jgi:hypothetical protein
VMYNQHYLDILESRGSVTLTALPSPGPIAGDAG